MNTSFEINKICRACLNSSDSLKHIYNSQLKDIFKNLTNLEIVENDGLPCHLCLTCVERLEICNSFRQLCIKSDHLFKERKINLETATRSLKSNIQNPENNTSAVFSRSTSSIPQLHELVNKNEEFSSEIEIKEDSHCFSEEEPIINHKENDNQIDTKRVKLLHTCQKCDKSFVLLDSLNKHIQKKHQLEDDTNNKLIYKKKENKQSTRKLKLNLSCPKCGQAFKKPDRLEAHLRVHAGKKPEVCKECNGEYANWKSLKLHMLTHTGVKKYVCIECGKRFTYPTALRIHERIHSGIRSYICDICGNSFLTSTNLKLHIATHSEERPYACDTCPQKFKCAATLRMHVFRHSGVKNFICTLCAHRSATKGELNAHMKTHSQEKPFACLVCSKKYKTANELNVHNRKHTGERPYKCDLCHMTFTISKVLKHHRMTHTGEKPHACGVCHRAFTQRSALKTHMKTHNRVNISF